jgi:hypothetical protein
MVDTGDSARSDLIFACDGNNDIDGPYMGSEWGKVTVSSVSNPGESDCLVEANANSKGRIYYRTFQSSMWICYVSQDGSEVAALHLISSPSDVKKTGVVEFYATVWSTGT